MRKSMLKFYLLLTILFLSNAEALHRDYILDCYDFNCEYDSEGDLCCETCSYPYCLTHSSAEYLCVDYDLLQLIPQTGPRCSKCFSQSIYAGYVDPLFFKYRPHLKQHLKFYRTHRYCNCYWPEYSQKAAEINDQAYLLFRDLLATTALSDLINDKIIQEKFLRLRDMLCRDIHIVTIAFIAQQFRFSDYYYLCRDLKEYANSTYNEQLAAQINEKLEDILEVLYPKYLKLHSSCYKKHPTADIEKEICFMKLLMGDISALENIDLFSSSKKNKNLFYETSEYQASHTEANATTMKENLKSKNSEFFGNNVVQSSGPSINKSVLESDILLELGTLLNDNLLYNKSIKVLTQAIQYNSSNQAAYIERAMAYFETNQLTLALKDYQAAKNCMIVSRFKIEKSELMMTIYMPEHKTEFSKGLIAGTIEGSKVSASEFIPSIFSCCRGILHGLWAFTCSPIDVSQEMIHTVYSLGEFISSHSAAECFQCVVPELKELALSWNHLNDHIRGRKIGFIIGKYGIDIFAPIGILKGVSKVRALKRANTMYTLESCAASQTKQAKILEESVRRASLRENFIIESIKNGKILIKSSNVQYHLMQPKHCWEKVLKLTGNVEEDFKRVAILLEKESIFSKEFLLRSKKFSQGKIIRSDYKKIINGHTIQAVFETYADTQQTFLKNAWVITE